MMKILVTGANGQLGQELNQLSKSLPEITFEFYTKAAWDITDVNVSESIIQNSNADILINTAAYTKVDQAEDETEDCFKLNAEAPGHLARICRTSRLKLIHISTDYVFNSNSVTPIKETEAKCPLGNYAISKSQGEDNIMLANRDSIIIRTSWLYSSFGHNFVKTMYKLGSSGKNIRVVSDQTGSPTYAKDLADCIIQTILHLKTKSDHPLSGYFHYSNKGSCSWHEFASEIFRYLDMNVSLTKISTAEFGAKAHRPFYSCLDCSRIQNELQIQIPEWKSSLHECLELIKNAEQKTLQ
jgi:dTDP-4-dehydrorhamnose reductase